MSDSCHLYTRLLLPKRHGYPLFHPQPFDDLPLESRHIGTEIGDVGVVTADGSFDIIFNVCRSANDPVNRFGVPEGFEQVQLGLGDVAPRALYHRPGSDVSSTTIIKRRLDVDAGAESNVFLPLGAGAVVEISTSSKETAVLLLPEGASRTDLRGKKKFRDYALKHAQRWYAFVNGDLGRMVNNGDLYLVTGTDKSSSWSVAAFENHSEDCKLSLKLKAALVGSAGASCFWEWETANSFANSGPRPLPADGERSENQTVFLRGFKVAIRASPLKKSAKAISIVDSKPSDILPKTGGSLFSQSRSTGTGSFFRNSPPSGSGGAKDNTESVDDGAEYFIGSPTQSAMVDATYILSTAGSPCFSRTCPTITDDYASSGSDRTSDDEESIVNSAEYFPGNPKAYHPGSTINDYLLNVTSIADVVVTHDDEWMSVLNENEEEFPDDCELIRRIFGKYDLDTSSAGICLRDLSREVSDPTDPNKTSAQSPSLGFPPSPSMPMQRPTCEGIRVRSPQDAHVIFHGVALGILPMITRRLDTEERRAITSGCVFVWEERGGRNTEPMGLGIERWTDSIRWGPSRVREEFLFYHEREHSSIDINIGMNYDSDAPSPLGYRPADVLMRGNLVKQIYSVFLETNNGRRKWHLIAYFTKDTVDYLRTVDDIPHLACIKVPAGMYKSARSAQRTRRTRATEQPYLGAFGGNNRHMPPRHVQEILLAPLEYLESLPPPCRHPVDEKALISFVPRLA